MSVNSFREDEEQKEVLKLDTLMRLYRYLLKYGKKIVIVLLIMCVTIAINLINPLIIERAVNVHIANKDMKGLMLLCLFGVGLNVINVAGIKLRMYMLAKYPTRCFSERKAGRSEHGGSSNPIPDTRPTGKILARVIGDVNSLKNILSDSVTTLIPDFITLVAVAVIMLVKNPKLALASFVTLPFLIAAMSIIEKLGHKRWQSFRKKTSNMNAYLHENLSGIRVVQSFAAEDESLESFSELVDEQKKAFVGAVRVSDMFSPTIEISWGVGGFLLYFIGIRVLGVGTVGASVHSWHSHRTCQCSGVLSEIWLTSIIRLSPTSRLQRECSISLIPSLTSATRRVRLSFTRLREGLSSTMYRLPTLMSLMLWS